MPIKYPLEMVFEDLQPAQREAVTRAVAALVLDMSAAGTMIRVTVQSPVDAYRLGQKTKEFLRSGFPPLPLRVDGTQ